MTEPNPGQRQPKPTSGAGDGQPSINTAAPQDREAGQTLADGELAISEVDRLSRCGAIARPEPVAAIADPTDAMTPEVQVKGSPVATVGPRPARILITHGEREMEALVNRALSERYVCEFASGVADARRRLADEAFDLLLSDVHSGGAAAIDLVEEVIEGDLDTAVVIIAESDDPALAQRAFDSGAYGYLVKPPWPGQLLMTVMNALRRRSLEIAESRHSQNLADRRQTIIDMAPIAIYAKDVSGRYTVVNAKADELAGMKPGELLGLTDEAFLAPDQMDVGADSDGRVIAEETAHERVDVLEIGGVTKTFKTVRFPLLDERGEISAVGGISVEITAEREAIRLRDELAASQLDAIEELRRSRQETIEGLAKAIDLHDSPTAEHVNRMAAIAAFLAAELGLAPNRVELLRAAAPMHDVGKIGTPAQLLRKPGPLTAAERTEMERHTVVGHRIFAHFESELARLAATIALTHHERYDGSGYPDGLAGEDIPLEGRITAVADVFDALLTDRSYRRAMSADEAVAVIRDARGTQFDPRVVDVLLGHLPEAFALRNT